MKKDKLVLTDGTEIELETSLGVSALIVNAESIDIACELWKKFTPGNLKQVSIKNTDDLKIGEYSNMVLDHVTGAGNKNGTVQIAFSLRDKTSEEMLTERVEALETGQQTHGEAIEDMGQAISDIAEGGTQ